MQIIYEAHLGMDRKDFADKDEARRVVEAHGVGSIVTFVRTSNFCGGHQDRSCALEVFENGAWRGVDISR